MNPARIGRLGSVGLVLLLHVAIVAALLLARFADGVIRRAPEAPHRTEIILPLPQLQKPSSAPAQGTEQRGNAVVSSHSPFTAPLPQGGTLGQTLFGCSVENLSTLSPEERQKCEHLTGFGYKAYASAPMVFAPKADTLSNSDIAARQRNTVDVCMAAKATGTECIHELLYGKGLP